MAIATQIEEVEPTALDWLHIRDNYGYLWEYRRGGNPSESSPPIHVTATVQPSGRGESRLNRGTDGVALLQQAGGGLPPRLVVDLPTGISAERGVWTWWQGPVEYTIQQRPVPGPRALTFEVYTCPMPLDCPIDIARFQDGYRNVVLDLLPGEEHGPFRNALRRIGFPADEPENLRVTYLYAPWEGHPESALVVARSVNLSRGEQVAVSNQCALMADS